MILILFILFNPFTTGKIEKLDFWDSILQTLKINHWRTTYAKSINLDIIKKLINVYSHRFGDLTVRR